jgi:hypothetical protein
MAQVIVLRPPPDDAAQALWHGVSTASNSISDLIDNIPCCGVHGEETRNELQQAQVLLGQAATALERTVARYRTWRPQEEVIRG